MTRRFIGAGFSGAGKLAVLSLAMMAALAMPLGASAHGWGGEHGHHGGDHGGYHGGYGGHGGYYGGHGGGHWSGGRWIAGAIVTGAVLGLVADSMRPAPVYYGAPVYSQPRTVIYEDGPPIVQRRVFETRTVVYDDQQTRYVRDDEGYDRDDDYDGN